MKLLIPKEIYREMIDHCLRCLPNEACGFLGGSGEEISSIYLLTNTAASPVYYRPDDREMISAVGAIEDSGMDLRAIFHSHVASPAYPSPTDIREAHYPDSVYLIVSLADRESPIAQGWMIHKAQWTDLSGDVEEIDLVIS